MKLSGLLLTFLLLPFYNYQSAANELVASITFSNPQEGTGISFVVSTNTSAESYTEVVNMGQLDCRFVPSKKYGYFKVDDALIFTSDRKLIFEIIYFDNGYDKFSFQYNAISSKYKSLSITKTNSNTWIKVKIGLVDAALANLQNNQADFRISGEAYIRQITISKGELDPAKEIVPVTTGSSYSEFKGKSVAGYQAWFTASESNSGWVHWSGNTKPAVGNFSFEIYPDTRDYPNAILKQTGFDNFGNGEPAVLFSSSDVIDEHFKWMKHSGIDGVALQRFIGDNPYPISESPFAIPQKVKNAAERNEKIFYICYDMSSGKDENAWVESIKFDWVYNIEQTYKLTSSPAYATVNNKPVVQVWGPGFTSRVGNAAGTIELIEFLQSRGCYVIGGVPTHWRTESGDSKPGFMNAYLTYDMVSPWTPGRYKNTLEADNFKINQLIPDKSFCDVNGLDYMPVLFPGFAWSTWNTGAPNSFPRLAGKFLWRQAYNIKDAGINQMYFAMFDEYDEGTAIMKAATDWSMIPTDQYFLTLSADGMWVSSDFYLRVAGAATTMLKSPEIPSEILTIPHSEGPVYYRNSFEKRYTEWIEKENGPLKNGIFNLDPCFYNAALLENSDVILPVCQIENDKANAKSGDYALRASGNPTSANHSSYDYKIAEVKIPVVENLKFSFWKKTIDELGKYVSLDLIFESGKRISQLPSYDDNNKNTMHPATGKGTVGVGYERFTCEIGKGELLGDKITGITVSYNKAASSGSYNAFFDDILFTTEGDSLSTGISNIYPKTAQRIIVENNVLNFTDTPEYTGVVIYNISGIAVKSFKLTERRVPVNLPDGIYIVSLKSDNSVYSQKIRIVK